ncbi:MAG: polar growth protein [Claussenomyces sp. TS43310]|nr:MAG: polar growth protein [Claussenomyces sp. TS43310]
MASRLNNTPSSARPEPGDILIVIHNFQARSSDELSLGKGDRVELVERDDEFGDGWYLGKFLTNGKTGLFPEVYTKPAPRGPPMYPTTATIPRSVPSLEPAPISVPASHTTDTRNSVPTSDAEKMTQPDRHASASQVLDASNSSPLVSEASLENVNGATSSSSTMTTTTMTTPRSVSMPSANNSQSQGQDSAVMNETLSVIQEHISDMNTPKHSINGDRRGTNDSSSEYSSHIDQRLSYINGEETDEEEEDMHNKLEIESWNPTQVADYLSSVGVESKHCDVFRDQEITGDVLLGMDQTSVFLKDLELGSVGKRLKTWQKIKTLQDEVSEKSSNGTRRTTQTYGSDGGSDDTGKRSRSTTSGTVLPRIPALMDDRPKNNVSVSRESVRRSRQTSARPETVISSSPIVPSSNIPNTSRRPSAASVRDLHHSRQNSANGTGANFRNSTTTIGATDSLKATAPENSHKKQHSFDRNWTMGSHLSFSPRPVSTVRPVSAAGSKVYLPNVELDDPVAPTLGLGSPLDLDRGYFSGGEAEGRQRNLLRKRGSTAHSRNSSYTDEQRLRSATTNARHSRFGSVDSYRDSQLSPASQKYYGLSLGSRRTPSADTISTRPMPPPKDGASPSVTKLDSVFGPTTESPKSSNNKKLANWLSSGIGSRGSDSRKGTDSTLGKEKSSGALPSDESSTLYSGRTPSRTGSSTPSGGPSFELESNSAKSPVAMTAPAGKAKRKKTKKETSAYTQGLEKKTPQEQMANCDYSGWMKKKSLNLMTTWKPRLFILKGRRLSYYYSEDDQEEKGLIDISFHRVLPADTDRLTGLHATLTGATTSPASPQNAHTPTMSSTEAAAEPQSTLSKPAADQMFIFKLVPPKPGFSRVNFTKPTVHYFAVPNVAIGRLWMAALMKATIDRDDTAPIVTTFQQKTITLAKARAMRHRPPALMNLDEKVEDSSVKTPTSDANGLNIRGIVFDKESNEGDSGVSDISKLANGVGQRASNHTDSTTPGTA